MAGLPECLGDAGRAVVALQPVALDPMAVEPGHRLAQETNSPGRLFVSQHLHIGHSRALSGDQSVFRWPTFRNRAMAFTSMWSRSPGRSHSWRCTGGLDSRFRRCTSPRRLRAQATVGKGLRAVERCGGGRSLSAIAVDQLCAAGCCARCGDPPERKIRLSGIGPASGRRSAARSRLPPPVRPGCGPAPSAGSQAGDSLSMSGRHSGVCTYMREVWLDGSQLAPSRPHASLGCVPWSGVKAEACDLIGDQ